MDAFTAWSTTLRFQPRRTRAFWVTGLTSEALFAANLAALAVTGALALVLPGEATSAALAVTLRTLLGTGALYLFTQVAFASTSDGRAALRDLPRRLRRNRR